jgi:uncharacterized protein (DUF433 family)
VPAVESIPGKMSGAWVFKRTRLPGATVIENLEDLSVDEVIEQFDVTREQIEAVLDFVAESLRAEPIPAGGFVSSDDGRPVPRLASPRTRRPPPSGSRGRYTHCAQTGRPPTDFSCTMLFRPLQLEGALRAKA